MDYLAEAADLLRKAAALNENRVAHRGTTRTDAEINEGRERIAGQFAQLAAIDRGLLPQSMLTEIVLAAVVASKV